MATNQRISGAHSTARSTSDIRINYGNPRQIIAASNTWGGEKRAQAQFYSFDGGVTWGQTTLPLVHGDTTHFGPAVDWTSDGTAWALTTGHGSGNGIRCYKSTDGGITWEFDSTVSGIQTDLCGALMWVDHSATSPHKDNIYAAWCDGYPWVDPNVSFVSRRAGPGGSWETPVQLNSGEDFFIPVNDITTNSAGDVFAFWGKAGNNVQNLYVSKSTDGGKSFATPTLIAATIAD